MLHFDMQLNEIVVRGKVTDENGDPLPGASVRVKNSKIGTSTDIEGNFVISVPSSESILVFTSIGSATAEVKVGNRSRVDIQLKPSGNNLNEVVVIGYGSQKRTEVTSAVSHVDTAEFRQSGARNALDLVQGKVAGLQITRGSGSNPNSGVNIQLRGVTSITGSQSPLIVIDGIPGGNLDLLQQDDIEAIDVLKDGSGAAIYGTQANAGVILITTKKGKAGPAQFRYSSYFRREYLAKRPDFLTAEEFRAKIQSGELNKQDLGETNDFFDAIINHDNLSQNHNLSMSGGTSNTSYRASLNYRDLQGFARENARKEYGLRLNINQRGLQDRLTAQINLATNFNAANLLGGGGWENQLSRNPTWPNKNPDGTWYFESNQFTNELARLEQETNKRKQQTSSADAKFELEILKGLKAGVFGSVLRNSTIDGEYRMLASQNSVFNGDYPGGGYASRVTTLSQDFAVEPTLQYITKVGENHNITAVGGYSYRYHLEEGFNANNRGFINDIRAENALGTGTGLSTGKSVGMGSYKNDNTLIAFFGRVNYSYDEKYLAQFILRREGSSRFGANNKWGNFPAASIGWTISREDFMQNLDFVDNLKLRAGYGVTGNSGIANYSSLVTLGTGGIYRYPDGKYYETYGPNKNPNPDLKWEKKEELNIGLDFTVFHNVLSGTIDVFSRKTKDLIDSYTSPQPPYVRNTITTNVGTISAKGIELALSYKAISKKDFTWNVDFTGSTTKNLLDSYSNDIYTRKYKTFSSIGNPGSLGDAITTYEGGRIGEFWGKRFAGFDETGRWLFYKRDGSTVYNDQINNSRDDLSVTDLAPLGNAVPKYYVSLTNNFTYKNFDLRIFLRGKFDYKILNSTAIAYGNKRTSGNLLRAAFDKYKDLNDTYMYSDYYLENGSHLKIDEITLGYTIKLKTQYVNSLRVYCAAQNLATITGYTGNDPDFIKDTGLDPGIDGRGPYPSTRSFLFGLSFGF
ncbi:SusC/RagA family TonB-linked outer membrane protein [Arcticibacter tournemirensis]|uniref:SusC/RagA family TonB-linked outer membrane protein n=2 Tax=Arcticibacter tournemirensis TaxID=699437 RepID=A0A4Q0MBL6_9SPHI|nr:SusC/RagA family TonB-linked outer membrane protein [Arcticibacter tournemirensis]